MSADATTDDGPVSDVSDADDPGADTPDASAVSDGGGAGPGRRRSVGPLIAIGLTVVLVVAAIAVAIVGGDDVSATAVRVNSTEVSQKTFNSELRELAPVLRDQGAPASEISDAFVSSSTAAQLAQIYVYSELLRGHVKVTDSDRAQVISGNRKELQQFAPSLRARIVDFTVMQNKLVADRGQSGAGRFVARLIRNADVHVDPRYGVWHPALAQVCPPTGCASSTAGSGG